MLQLTTARGLLVGALSCALSFQVDILPSDSYSGNVQPLNGVPFGCYSSDRNEEAATPRAATSTELLEMPMGGDTLERATPYSPDHCRSQSGGSWLVSLVDSPFAFCPILISNPREGTREVAKTVADPGTIPNRGVVPGRGLRRGRSCPDGDHGSGEAGGYHCACRCSDSCSDSRTD